MQRVALHVRLARSTERVLGGLQFWKNTAQLIERADLPLRTGEVFYIQLGCALLFGMPAGFAGVFPLVVLGLFALGFFAPFLYLKLAAGSASGRSRTSCRTRSSRWPRR